MQAAERLTRVTTDYDRAQDRIRLVAELQGGGVTIIWVTQRLLQRLVQELVVWLEATEKDTPRADILLGFKQQSAQQGLTPQAPVRAPAEAGDWLCQAVDLQKRESAVSLTFRDADAAHKVRLDLAVQPLRQWLNMLFLTCQRAEWPLTVWPDWIREQAPGPRPRDMPLH